jgi:hypothetical protein
VATGLPHVVHPPHHCRPQTMTHPAPQEPPHGPRAPRGRPAPREPPPLRPSTTPELSAARGHAAPQEVAIVAIESLLCPANKCITYIK